MYKGINISFAASSWWCVSVTRSPQDMVIQYNGRRDRGCVVVDWSAEYEPGKCSQCCSYLFSGIVNKVVDVGDVELAFIQLCMNMVIFIVPPWCCRLSHIVNEVHLLFYSVLIIGCFKDVVTMYNWRLPWDVDRLPKIFLGAVVRYKEENIDQFRCEPHAKVVDECLRRCWCSFIIWYGQIVRGKRNKIVHGSMLFVERWLKMSLLDYPLKNKLNAKSSHTYVYRTVFFGIYAWMYSVSFAHRDLGACYDGGNGTLVKSWRGCVDGLKLSGSGGSGRVSTACPKRSL